MSMVGRTYLEGGEPVVVLAKWRGRLDVDEKKIGRVGGKGVTLRSEGSFPSDDTPVIRFPGRLSKTGPRNVLIQRANGDLVIRPFRGLRSATPSTSEPNA